LLTLPASEFEPGAEGTFALPASIYHSQVMAPGISRTLVVELLQLSPAHAKTLLDGTYHKRETPAMVGGTMVDLALLEPDKFQEGLSHWVVPSGMNLATKEGIAWKKDHPGLPRIRATSDAENTVSVENIHGMIESLMKSPKVRRIIEQGTKQESAFALDPETGLMRKVRSDVRLVDNQSRLVITDLKSTFRGGTSSEAWRKHCARMAYHIQDSFYSHVYQSLTGEMPFFLFIAVERKPPYAVRLFQLDPEGKECGRTRCQIAMYQFRQCIDSGLWPAFNDDIETISLPKWELAAPDPEPIDI